MPGATGNVISNLPRPNGAPEAKTGLRFPFGRPTATASPTYSERPLLRTKQQGPFAVQSRDSQAAASWKASGAGALRFNKEQQPENAPKRKSLEPLQL